MSYDYDYGFLRQVLTYYGQEAAGLINEAKTLTDPGHIKAKRRFAGNALMNMASGIEMELASMPSVSAVHWNADVLMQTLNAAASKLMAGEQSTIENLLGKAKEFEDSLPPEQP